MQGVQDSFWNHWNQQLASYFHLDGDFNIRDYVCVFGGFQVPSLDVLPKEFHAFFCKNNVRIDGWYHLRGFMYYAADPLMYLPDRVPSDVERLMVVKQRWHSLQSLDLGHPSTSHLGFFEWVAYLSFLEYLYNDISTLLWACYRLGIDGLQPLAERLSSMLAGLIVLDKKVDIPFLNDSIKDVVCDSEIFRIIDALSGPLSRTSGFIRAIREADSMAVIYSAFLLKLQPWVEQNPDEEIILLDNAFGAINVGRLFRCMLKVPCKYGTVYFSQNRVDSPLLGSGNDKVRVFTGDTITETTKAVVIDDCIFTGKSFSSIREHFEADGVYTIMLPLMLDSNSLRYCRIFNKTTEELVADAEFAIQTANQMNDTPPSFSAFWEWDKNSQCADIDAPDSYVKVMNGGDLLLKTLWARFRGSIL